MPQMNQKNAGSSQESEPAFLVVGKLRRPHGVRGEIPMEIYTDFVELLTPGLTLYIGESYQPHQIESTRWKGDLILLKFKDIDDRTVVSSLTNDLVFIDEEELPPPSEGTFYPHQLIDLDVYDEAGVFLGSIQQILVTGANDVLLILTEAGDEMLLPVIEDVILDVDFSENRMTIRPLAWYGEDSS